MMGAKCLMGVEEGWKCEYTLRRRSEEGVRVGRVFIGSGYGFGCTVPIS